MTTPRATGPQALAEALAAGRSWLLASHRNPDGDAIGALVGLGLILEAAGKKIVLHNASGAPELYRFLPGAEKIQTDLGDLAGFDGLVILDSGEPERVGPLFERLAAFDPVINLDHHLPRAEWGHLAWVDAAAPAVGLMVLDLAKRMGAPVTPQAALNLYVALMTDTGSFRHENTTAAALAGAAELVALGADPALAARRIYQTYTPGRVRLLARVLASLELLEEGRLGLLIARRADFEATGTGSADLENFIDFARAIGGVQVAALLREEAAGCKLSLRTAEPLDAAELAGRWGGGGHRRAAGGFIPADLAQARTALLAETRKALHA